MTTVAGRPASPGWMLAGLACLALAIALIAVVALTPSSVRLADHQWLRWMLDVRAASGVFTAKVLNVVAGGTVMWVVRAAIAAALAIWRRWRALAVFALAELCAELCIGPVKALVDRPRPAGSLVAVTGQSMPSGHALIGGGDRCRAGAHPDPARQVPAAGHHGRRSLVNSRCAESYLPERTLADRRARQPAARDGMGSTMVRRARTQPGHALSTNHHRPGP